MMDKDVRFLIGNGEQLTGPVEVPKGFGKKRHPYTLDQAKKDLLPLLEAAAAKVAALPAVACPGDNAVGVVTLHPAYLAKSYYPQEFLRSAGLEALGSRARKIQPRVVLPPKGKPEQPESKEPVEQVTSELFVAGPRKQLKELPRRVRAARERTGFADDVIKVETFRIPEPDERIRPPRKGGREVLLEVVLHTGRTRRMRQLVLEGFEAFLGQYDLQPQFDRLFEAEALCFMPLRAPRDRVRDIAGFTFLRVVREMPSLRQFRPFFRDVAGMEAFRVELPSETAVEKSVRVAVFDGGLPVDRSLKPWAQAHDVPGIGVAVPEFERHGLAVTSAVLFGPLDEDIKPERPPAVVDHYRVLDAESANDPQGELYDVLRRIETVLKHKPYVFVNLSIGPDLPVEDDDPSAWTTVLDQHFGAQGMLATVAVGNRGEENPVTGYTRIQPPSDCVNALAVGACDSRSPSWKRASYSCTGPGRCPGYVKPDLVAFGGSRKEPFWVLDARKPGHASAVTGTSFASPTALRLGLMARAYFGQVLTPLGLKALLVHRCEDGGLPRPEVGWGRVPEDVIGLMACGPGEVHVLYQDVLNPRRWMRAHIPVPEHLSGMVTVSATICFATAIDPQDPVNYTRSGVEVIFRPHIDRRSDDEQLHPDSRSFFSMKLFGSTEQELRAEAHKWETTLHHSGRLQSRSLKEPFFDIHYVAREEGRDTASAAIIPYALVVSVQAPKVKDLFDQTLRRYPVLQHLRPVVQIPIRV